MKETVVKINKTKSWFFEKIKKLTNLQPDSSRERVKNQINKIRNEKGEDTTDNVEIQKIIRDCLNNYMETKCITWKKWTDSQKSSIFQD